MKSKRGRIVVGVLVLLAATIYLLWPAGPLTPGGVAGTVAQVPLPSVTARPTGPAPRAASQKVDRCFVQLYLVTGAANCDTACLARRLRDPELAHFVRERWGSDDMIEHPRPAPRSRHGRLLYALAQADIQDGHGIYSNMEAATATLRALVNDGEANGYPRYYLAAVLLKQGRTAEARAELRRARGAQVFFSYVRDMTKRIYSTTLNEDLAAFLLLMERWERTPIPSLAALREVARLDPEAMEHLGRELTVHARLDEGRFPGITWNTIENDFGVQLLTEVGAPLEEARPTREWGEGAWPLVPDDGDCTVEATLKEQQRLAEELNKEGL
jgi:hypothetical protein